MLCAPKACSKRGRQVPEAERAVRDLLQRYFDALYASDADALRAVLHPRAIYVCATGEDFVYKTVDEYLPVVAERPSPASRNEARRDSIDSIELAGANTARARVRCSIGDRDFIDFLIALPLNAAVGCLSLNLYISSMILSAAA